MDWDNKTPLGSDLVQRIEGIPEVHLVLAGWLLLLPLLVVQTVEEYLDGLQG